MVYNSRLSLLNTLTKTDPIIRRVLIDTVYKSIYSLVVDVLSFVEIIYNTYNPCFGKKVEDIVDTEIKPTVIECMLMQPGVNNKQLDSIIHELVDVLKLLVLDVAKMVLNIPIPLEYRRRRVTISLVSLDNFNWVNTLIEPEPTTVDVELIFRMTR